MCGNFFNPHSQSFLANNHDGGLSSVALGAGLTLLGAPELAGFTGLGTAAATGLTGSLVGAGLGGLQGGLGGALQGGALGGIGGYLGGGGLSDIADATGLSGIGSGISNGLSNISDSSGLSQLWGGTAQPTDNFGSFNLDSAPNLDATAGATNPVNFAPGGASSSYTAGAAAPGGAGLGGGTFTGFGESPADIGEATSLGSAQGGASPLSAPALNAGGAGAAQGNGFNFDLGGNAAAAPSGAGSGIGAAPSSSFQNLLGNSNLGSGNFDIGGNPAGASSYSIGQQFANGLNPSGGSGVDLSSLFGGSGSTGGAGATGSIANGLLRGGLGYLTNNNNGSGERAISAASNQAQQNFAPYLAAGNQAEGTLASLYGNNGTAAQTAAQANFANTPGYQFALGQGLNSVNANAAATGQLLSGNNQEAINNYAQGTASQQYNNYINQLQNMASGGLSAAGGSGTAGLTGASAQAQLGQNNANNRNTAIGTGLSAMFPGTGMTLQQLLSQGGNNGSSGLLSALGF